MIRSTLLPLLSVLLAAASHAGETTIEPRPFSIEKSFTATAMPDSGCMLIQAEPESWADFQITELAAHGGRVAKGDVLVRFDARDIDKKIEDTRRSLASGALTLAQAELELKNHEETASNKLDAARRSAEIAKEENTYFVKTRRKATEETAAHELDRKRQYLENQKEELRQLAKMYQADDLTKQPEETEEIILTRQKDAVVSAEFALRMETLDCKRTVDVILPREAVTLANNERDTAINQRKAEVEIPRSIEIRKIELEVMKTSRKREQDTLARLEHDRGMFEFKAPAAGWFYHGVIENGRWTTGETVKNVFLHGRPLVNRPFATFVPATAKLALVAFLDEAAARTLKSGLTGNATLAGREDLEIPVKLTKIAPTPGLDGTYRADLTAEWPQDPAPVTGSSAQVRVTSYQQPAAIVVPLKALSHRTGVWTAEVKLADGKTERRPVKRGRVTGEDVEILSGLEAGQVVITPEK